MQHQNFKHCLRLAFALCVLQTPSRADWGYIDHSGNTVIKPQPLVNAETFRKGKSVVWLPDEGSLYHFGEINSNGVIVSDAQPAWGYDEANDRPLPVQDRVTHAWGFTDKGGRITVPCRFLKVGLFSEGLAPVQGRCGWGFVDRAGKVVQAFPYASDLTELSEGLAILSSNKWIGDPGGYGWYEKRCVDRHGNVVFSAPNLSEIRPFKNGYAPVLSRAKWGFIDHTGRIVIEPQYDLVDSFSEGLAAVGNRYISKPNQVWPLPWDCKWGYIDFTGRMVISAEFLDAGSFSEGLAAVATEVHTDKGKQQLTGFIGRDGLFVIPPKYLRAKSFSEGLAAVKVLGMVPDFSRSVKVIPPLIADLDGAWNGVDIDK